MEHDRGHPQATASNGPRSSSTPPTSTGPQVLAPGVSVGRGRWYDSLRYRWRSFVGKRANHIQHGDIYNTTNLHNAPVTTINHANNVHFPMVTVAADEDITLFGTLQKQPDVSGQWTDYMEGSRTKEIKEICDWADDKAASGILWIHAAAGLGKSTLARQLKHHLHSQGRLAAAIFLSQLPTDSLGPETVIQLIASELGRTHRRAVPAIATAIRQSHGASLEVQIEMFLRNPLLSLGLPHSLTVILDAVDEWRTHYNLISELGPLTSHQSLVRFLVLSRSEPKERLFKNIPIRPYPLLPVTVEVMQEYLAKRFKTIEWAFGRIPTEDEVSRLAGMANGLFIWLSVVCSLLGESYSNPQEMLTSILRSRHNVGSANNQLALLYYKAIAQLFPQPEDKAMLKEFLGYSMVIQEPLSLDAFSQLSRLPVYSLKKIGVSLTALQIRRPADSGTVVHPASNLFHASFLEYLRGTLMPPDIAFPIPPSAYHAKLGEACLDMLPGFLLASPELNNLHLSQANEYAVLYWPWHISRTLYSTNLGGADNVGPTLEHNLLQGNGVSALWCMQQWACIFATLLGVSIEGGRPGGDTVNTLLRNVARLLHAASTSTVVFGIPCLDVAAHLAAGDAPSWYKLGRAYQDQAEVDDSLELVHRAVASFQHAVNVSGAVSAKQTHYLGSLALSLTERFQRTGDTKDLSESICLERDIILLYPSGHPDRLPFLNNLATSLQYSFQVSGGAGKLEEAIALHREVLALRPPGHPDLSFSLNNLANSLQTSFKVSGGAGKLEEAISSHREALSLRPSGHPDRSISLNNLANSLQASFKVSGGAGKLEEAIALHRDALSLCPPGHPDQSTCLNNLANSLQTSFDVSGGAGKLEEAIALLRDALSLCPPGHPDRSTCLNSLANGLRTSFKVSGGAGKLEEAIALHREAITLRPPGHPERSSSLNNLATSLRISFQVSGGAGKLEEAIALHRYALSLHPPGHPDRSISLSNLANSLQTSFEVSGGADELEEAISLHREALALFPSGHPGRSSSLNNLANDLRSSFKISGGAGKLEEAIVLHREALSLRPPGHPDRYSSLHNLANCLQDDFTVSGNMAYLDEAIMRQRECLSLRPGGHPRRPEALYWLRLTLYDRFNTNGIIKDFHEAVASAEEELSLYAPDDRHRNQVVEWLSTHREEQVQRQRIVR